ncbi:hypothetical protein VDGD_21617 [Verticillium dahliae]|nr:hypothetical protein VDGD_21617 [Verticillium dahliae]
MPATEAVPMMEPPAWGLADDVSCIAGAACLAARKTLVLSACAHAEEWPSEPESDPESNPQRLNTPQHVGAHHLHKVRLGDVGEQGHGPDDAGVGEEDVEAAVGRDGVRDDVPDGLLLSGVEAAHVDLDGRVRSPDLGGVGVEVRAVKVAEVQGARAVLGKLVGGGAADAEGRVGARDDDDLAGDARRRRGAGHLCDGGQRRRRRRAAGGQLVAQRRDSVFGGWGHDGGSGEGSGDYEGAAVLDSAGNVASLHVVCDRGSVSDVASMEGGGWIEQLASRGSWRSTWVSWGKAGVRCSHESPEPQSHTLTVNSSAFMSMLRT